MSIQRVKDYESHNSNCVTIRVMCNHTIVSDKINYVRYDNFCLEFSAYNWGNITNHKDTHTHTCTPADQIPIDDNPNSSLE